MADKTIPALKILRGKVGINIATPTQQLHVNGEAFISTGSTSVRTLSGIFKADTIENSAGASNLKLQTEAGGNKHIEITPNGTGNVGIGTNTPSKLLELYGGGLRLPNGNSIDWNNENTRILASHASQYIRFDVGGTSNVLYATPTYVSFTPKLIAGSSSTTGGSWLEKNYTGANKLNVLSSKYSSGNTIIGYGAKGKSGSGGYVATYGNFSGKKSIIELSASTLYFKVTDSAAQDTIGDDITLNQRLAVDKDSMTFTSSGGTGLIVNRTSATAYLQLFPSYSNVPTIMGKGAGGLHLSYNSSTSGIRIDTSNNVIIKDNILYFGSTAGGFVYNDSGVMRVSGDAGIKLQTYVGGWQDRLVILDDGNVGIGTDGPAKKLEVNFTGDDGLQVQNTGSSHASIWLEGGTGGVGGAYLRLTSRDGTNTMTHWINLQSNGNLVFRPAATGTAANQIIFNQNGSIGVGGTPPSGYKFYVNGLTHLNSGVLIGDSSNTGTTLTIRAQNTSGAPAATAKIIMQGYEGRGIGTFYEDSSYSGEQWFCGMNYSGSFNSWNVGYDASGDQAEYVANTLLQLHYTGKLQLYAYGSGTHTGTAAYKLAVDSSGNIIETAVGSGQVDGSGTANYVTKWTDGDTIGNSSIFDNGSVGIGTNNPSCLLQLGTDGVQGGASLAIRRNGDSINFGHVNGAGYGSVIGCSSNNGYPHIGFMCEAGTNNNTFRTRGLKGNVIYTNTSGTLIFGQVTNANADNQSVTTRVAIESDGDAYFYGGNWFCNYNNSTNVSNGGLYINRGGGLHAYALAAARSGTGLGGVDFWDYHGVGLVFGPDSSTKVLTVKSNIGIGTTDPGYKLEVKASVTGNWLSRIYNTATSGNSSGLLVRMDEPGSTGIAFGVYANGGYKFRVEPDGEVQILSGAAYTTHLNYQNSGTHYITMANGGYTYFRGSSNSITTMTVTGAGKVGILDSSPQTTLAVNGEASFGDGARLSLIGLNIASSAASPNIKIRTKIPFALGGADFTVNIKGFIYGNQETANLTVCWHYYNSTFYNATCSSAGSWAPTIQLSAEDWDSSGTKKVCICLSTPGYWVKMYVESMFSNNYNDAYADGWTWVDGTASGTGNDLASLSYRSDFGNNFKMLSNGCVGIGGGILTNAQLTVNGAVAIGDTAYQSNMNGGNADFSVDCNGTPQISWLSNYLQVGGTNQNWDMRMSTSLLQTYSSNLTITAGGTGTTYKLYLGTNGQTQTITCNNGSVGIGTNAPKSKLFVASGELMVDYGSGGSNGGAAMRIATNSNEAFIQSNAYYDSSLKHARAQASSLIAFKLDATRGGDIVFQTAPSASADANMTLTERMTIKRAGNIGIGTTDPDSLLMVYKSSADSIVHVRGANSGADARVRINGYNSSELYIDRNGVGRFAFRRTTGTDDLSLLKLNDNYSDNSTIMFWDYSSGNVGIASASPAATLDVKQGTATNNNKLMKVADDVLSVYKVTSLSNHTVTLTCGSYFQAEVVITANQTNGGTYNNLYIRGIWSNNHHSHHWDEIENIGSLSGSSFSIAVSANDVSNSGKLVITHTYSSGSFSQMVVRVTDLFGVHSYSIT